MYCRILLFKGSLVSSFSKPLAAFEQTTSLQSDHRTTSWLRSFLSILPRYKKKAGNGRASRQFLRFAKNRKQKHMTSLIVVVYNFSWHLDKQVLKTDWAIESSDENHDSSFSKSSVWTQNGAWLVVSTHLKNIRQKWVHLPPIFRGEHI